MQWPSPGHRNGSYGWHASVSKKERERKGGGIKTKIVYNWNFELLLCGRKVAKRVYCVCVLDLALMGNETEHLIQSCRFCMLIHNNAHHRVHDHALFLCTANVMFCSIFRVQHINIKCLYSVRHQSVREHLNDGHRTRTCG